MLTISVHLLVSSFHIALNYVKECTTVNSCIKGKLWAYVFFSSIWQSLVFIVIKWYSTLVKKEKGEAGLEDDGDGKLTVESLDWGTTATVSTPY